MVPNALMFKAASVLTAAAIVLTLANWYAKPEAALAFAAVLAMSVAMVAALRASRRAVRHSTMEARSLDRIPTAVVFAALMMGIPLALTLAHSYGVVDDIDLGRRSTGILMGTFLMMLGNVMPKNLPPLSATGGDGKRQQAFLRLAGWTWVLCGLASAVGWLALSTDSAEISNAVLVVSALVVTVVQLLRLRRPRKDQPAPELN